MRKNLYSVVLGVCTVLALSACDALDLTPEPTGGAPAAAASGTPQAVVTETVTAAPEPTRTAGSLVKAVQATIGTIVTTGDDLPLYRWDKDSPNTSTCYDTCAQQFTAYPWSADLGLEGVERGYVGKVQRTDGTWQLTLGRQPVYTHVKDEAGTWKAQGQNGAWWLATPTGGKLTAKS